MPATFMGLPRELRDRIIDYIVSWPMQEPPSLLDHVTLRAKRLELLQPRLTAWTSGHWVRYLQPTCVMHGSPLLSVSHQLYLETLEALARYQDRHVYLIDIVILNEIEVLPTWIHVPQLTATVDRFHTTIRIAGNYDPALYAEVEDTHIFKGFRLSETVIRPAMEWILFSVLERFLLVGPIAQCGGAQFSPKKVTIKNFIIDVFTPTDISSDRFGEPQSVHPDDFAFNPKHVLSPHYLFEFIRSNMRWLLEMNSDSCNYGALLYEHIGSIIFAFDGAERSVFDLNEALRLIDATNAFGADKSHFETWREKTLLRRQELGLGTKST